MKKQIKFPSVFHKINTHTQSKFATHYKPSIFERERDFSESTNRVTANRSEAIEKLREIKREQTLLGSLYPSVTGEGTVWIASLAPVIHQIQIQNQNQNQINPTPNRNESSGYKSPETLYITTSVSSMCCVCVCIYNTPVIFKKRILIGAKLESRRQKPYLSRVCLCCREVEAVSRN